MTVGLLVYMGSCKGSATMGAIGNFLWFVLGGVLLGLRWWLLGPLQALLDRLEARTVKTVFLVADERGQPFTLGAMRNASGRPGRWLVRSSQYAIYARRREATRMTSTPRRCCSATPTKARPQSTVDNASASVRNRSCAP